MSRVSMLCFQSVTSTQTGTAEYLLFFMLNICPISGESPIQTPTILSADTLKVDGNVQKNRVKSSKSKIYAEYILADKKNKNQEIHKSILLYIEKPRILKKLEEISKSNFYVRAVAKSLHSMLEQCNHPVLFRQIIEFAEYSCHIKCQPNEASILPECFTFNIVGNSLTQYRNYLNELLSTEGVHCQNNSSPVKVESNNTL